MCFLGLSFFWGQSGVEVFVKKRLNELAEQSFFRVEYEENRERIDKFIASNYERYIDYENSRLMPVLFLRDLREEMGFSREYQEGWFLG